mgnify:CR=1 FL=1|tara:strand:- start:1008 stop:1901 length:894 start_codon:yes stop_codon:yes gene_type:complete
MHIEEIEIKDGGIHKHLLFESGRWDDFLTAAKSPPKGWKYRKGSRKVSEKFSGSKDFAEAMSMAENGWPEGRVAFADIAAQSVQQMEAVLPVVGYDVAGMYPSVPRFLGGDQECMVTHDPDINDRRHIIPIYAGISASASNKKETIINRGAAIAGLIDRLETSGHSVQLVVFEHSVADLIRYWGEYELKAAGEPLDLDMMAFALTHPSCLRRLHFAVMEANGFRFGGAFADAYKGSYGVPANGLPPEVKSQLADGPTLMFDGLKGCHDSTFGTITSATNAVLAEWEKAQDQISWNAL